MKLYTFDIAPNPRRVGLFLKEKGVSLDTIPVDLGKGEQFSSPLIDVNPDSTVPALVLDDGTVLTDVIAICLYLESLYPEPPLFGQTPLEQAQVVGWCHRIYINGLGAVAEVLRNKSEMFKGRALPGAVPLPQIPELAERGNARITAFFEAMDKEVAEKDYLVGDRLSQADIDLYASLGFCGWVQRAVPEECQALTAWLAKMRAHFGE